MLILSNKKTRSNNISWESTHSRRKCSTWVFLALKEFEVDNIPSQKEREDKLLKIHTYVQNFEIEKNYKLIALRNPHGFRAAQEEMTIILWKRKEV